MLAAGAVAAMLIGLAACGGSPPDTKPVMEASPTTVPAGVTPATVGDGASAAPADAAPSESTTTTAAAPTFTPTPEGVQQAAERSSRSSFRYRVNLDVAGLGGLPENTDGGALVTGAYDGEQLDMHLDVIAGLTGAVGLSDLLPLLNLLPADLAEITTLDMVIDGDTLYAHTPLFSTLLGVVPSGLPGLEIITTLKALGEGWTSIDLPALGVLTSFATSLNASRGLNPGVILNLLRRTRQVTDLGSDTLDGVPVRGVATNLNVGDVLDSRGIPVAVLGQAAVLAEVTFRAEAWVDNEGRVREVKLYVGQDTFVESMNGAGLTDDGLLDLGLMAGVVVDFTDYGDPSIAVDVPANATDITPDLDVLPQLSDVLPAA